MPATADAVTAEELAVLVAMKQARMNQMNEFAVRRSARIVLEAPGRERYRLTRTAEDDVEELLARHRAAILAGARQRLLALDPVALEARPVHLVDFDDLGARTDIVGGFTLADGGWRDLRSILPADAPPGPVIALNIRAEVADAVRSCPIDSPEPEIVETAARIVRWVAVHEYAHVVDCEAAGRIVRPDITVPGPPDVAHVVAALNQPRDIRDTLAAHGPAWILALYHLQRRDGWRTYDLAIDEWWLDVARFLGDPAEIAAALGAAWDSSTTRERLVDVLRRPAPARYLDLVRARTPQEMPA